jgi:hypothetical protein
MVIPGTRDSIGCAIQKDHELLPTQSGQGEAITTRRKIIVVVVTFIREDGPVHVIPVSLVRHEGRGPALIAPFFTARLSFTTFSALTFLATFATFATFATLIPGLTPSVPAVIIACGMGVVGRVTPHASKQAKQKRRKEYAAHGKPPKMRQHISDIHGMSAKPAVVSVMR